MDDLTIASIYKELKKYSDKDSGAYTKAGNSIVEIIDTPRMWGVPFKNKSDIENKGTEAKDTINNIITFIIKNAVSNIDIVSLAPPTGIFLDTIIHELTEKFEGEHNISLVRFLFGYLPGGEDTVLKFRNHLASKLKKYDKQTLDLYVGRVHGGERGGGWGPLSPWNHAKIVTADGRYALAGGHNLWPNNYADYPPVHDISLFIRGEGAVAAQNFANFLWTLPGTKPVTGRPKWTRYYKYDFINGIFPGDNSIKNKRWETAKPKIAVVETESELKAYKGVNEYTTEGIPVLGVGRYSSVDTDIQNHAGKKTSTGYASPSEKVKELVIKTATNRLYICQQDIVFLGAAGIKSHNVVKWIVESLYTNKTLVVKIVISSKNAKSKDGAQYSWGSGALGTYKIIYDVICEKYKSSKENILARLHVAPFCFTNVNISRAGAGYSWDETDKYSGKQAQFSTKVPMPKLYASGYPEPANHSKYYMGVCNDGTAVYYVGSDNLYPHDLFEFGYMVDDKAATKLIYDKYWTQVWKYSGVNCVCLRCRASARSVLNDSMMEYKETLGGYFRKPSIESRQAVELIESFLDGKKEATPAGCKYVIFCLRGYKDLWKEKIPNECISLKIPIAGGTFKNILDKNVSERFGDEKF